MGYNTLPKNPWPMSSDQSGGGMDVLPIAGAETLGGVKVGNGLSINAETGVLTLSSDVIRENDIALQFNENSSYLDGDFCYYNGTLYRFEEDHDGSWDADDVLAVRVCDSIISEFGEGLQRMANSLSVKIENNGGLAFNNDGELYAEGLNNYSTTEQATGQNWIDGKPIYFKVLHFEEETEQTRKTYTTEISALSIDALIDLKAIVKLGAAGNGDWYTSPFFYDNTKQLSVSGTNSMLNVYSDGWKFTEAYVTLYYTKVTT